MSPQLASFQKVLDALLDEKKEFPRRYLREFSDIDSLELKTLLDVWPHVKPSRKLSLLEELESLADKDTLVCFDDFARTLLTDPDSAVRARAMRLLSECEDPHLVPTYVNILQHDSDVHTRAEAASALGAFVLLGELEEISENFHHQAEDALLSATKGDDQSLVRRCALESLGYSSRDEVTTLIESAYRRENPDWVASALVAMGRSNDNHWQEPVIHSMLSESQPVREAAVQAAGELNLKSARPILLRLLEEEEDEDVTSAAIWSLSQIGGEDVRTYIENLLDQTEDEEQIEFLEEALDNLAFTEDLDRFELMSFDGDDDWDELEKLDEE